MPPVSFNNIIVLVADAWQIIFEYLRYKLLVRESYGTAGARKFTDQTANPIGGCAVECVLLRTVYKCPRDSVHLQAEMAWRQLWPFYARCHLDIQTRSVSLPTAPPPKPYPFRAATPHSLPVVQTPLR